MAWWVRGGFACLLVGGLVGCGGDRRGDSGGGSSCEELCSRVEMTCADDPSVTIDGAECRSRCPSLGTVTRTCLAETPTCLGILDCLLGRFDAGGPDAGDIDAGPPAVERFGGELGLAWLRTAGTESIERAVSATAHPGGGLVVVGAAPRGTSLVLGEGEPAEAMVQGGTFVARYEEDGALRWLVSMTAANGVSPGRPGVLSDGRLAFAGGFRGVLDRRTEWEMTVRRAASEEIHALPREGDSALPFVLVLDDADGSTLHFSASPSAGAVVPRGPSFQIVGAQLVTVDASYAASAERRLVDGFELVTLRAFAAGDDVVAVMHLRQGATAVLDVDGEARSLSADGGTLVLARLGPDGSIAALAQHDGIRGDPEPKDAQPLDDGTFVVAGTEHTADDRASAHSAAFLYRFDAALGIIWQRAASTRTGSLAVAATGAHVWLAAGFEDGASLPLNADGSMELIAAAEQEGSSAVAVYDLEGTLVAFDQAPVTGYVRDLEPVPGGVALVGEYDEPGSFLTGASGETRASAGGGDFFVGVVSMR